MATSCILYPQEKFVVPVEPSRDSKQTETEAPVISNIGVLRATLRALTNGIPGVPPEEALLLEIENLCMATLVIDQAFCDIGRRLSDATKEQKKRTDLDDLCCALDTQWNEHHQTYQSLIWHSRETAGEAQSAVDDFRDLVLPSLRDQDVTLPEKREIIQRQLEVLQKLAEPSKNISQEFLNFGRALDVYIVEFSKVVDGFGIVQQFQKVDGLEERLRNARASMEVVSQEVTKLGRRFAVDVLVTSIEFLLAFVAPSWWEKLAGVAVITINYAQAQHPGPALFEARERCNRAVAEYEAIKAEYEFERACLGQMAKLESTLHDSRPVVQDIITRLGIFAGVWAAIKADMGQLRGLLLHAEDIESPLFNLRVQKLEKMYGYLSRALRQYQVAIWAPMPGTFVPL